MKYRSSHPGGTREKVLVNAMDRRQLRNQSSQRMARSPRMDLVTHKFEIFITIPRCCVLIEIMHTQDMKGRNVCIGKTGYMHVQTCGV